jgi:large subunit ribosomal protein L4
MSTEQEGENPPPEPKQVTEPEPAAAEGSPTQADTAEADTAEAGTAKPAAKPKAATRSRAKAAAEDAAEKPSAKAAAEEVPAEKPAKASARKAPATGKAAAAKKAAASPARNREIVTDLPADIFDDNVNIPLIHQVVVAQQAAARQGTHATKTRGDVRGGGKKPYRQKGTGRARQGSIRAPQFTGGGVVHGPVPRSYAQRTPKKMKAAALRGALSDRARHGFVHVVDGFVDGDVPKTREALSVLAAVTGSANGAASVLVVAEHADQLTWKSLRNAPGVHLIDPGQLNTYDVLVNDRVVFTGSAFESFVARAGAAGKQEGE